MNIELKKSQNDSPLRDLWEHLVIEGEEEVHFAKYHLCEKKDQSGSGHPDLSETPRAESMGEETEPPKTPPV